MRCEIGNSETIAEPVGLRTDKAFAGSAAYPGRARRELAESFLIGSSERCLAPEEERDLSDHFARLFRLRAVARICSPSVPEADLTRCPAVGLTIGLRGGKCREHQIARARPVP
jgi:hypothetical protein